MVVFFFFPFHHGSLLQKGKAKQIKIPLQQYILSDGYAFLEGIMKNGYFSQVNLLPGVSSPIAKYF